MAANGTARVARRELLVRELLCVMVLTMILMVLAIALPVEFHPVDPRASISAPWPVAWLQQLLRFLPVSLAGIILPAAMLIYLALLPWLPGSHKPDPERSYRFGLHPVIVLCLGLLWVLLTVFGL
jgi:quinol-cytochrome oxidoreductase complex cytochrome b subunit